MPDLKELWSRVKATVKGAPPTKAVMQRHVMTPVSESPDFTQDELMYLGINPYEKTMDVYPVTSAAAAHGYLYLQSRALFDLLDEMYDRDTVINGCVELIIAYMLMRPQGLTLSEEDADKPGAKEALDLVQRQLLDNCNWAYLMWSLAEGLLRHGRSTVEITWRVTPEGYYTPHKYYHCHPGQFTFDRDGNMFIAGNGLDGKHTPLHPLKFITVARPALYDNPWGSSLIYPLRFVYYFKKKAMVFRLRYAENNGEPIYIGKVNHPNDVAPDPDLSQRRLAEGLSSIGRNNFMVLGTGESVEVTNRPMGSSGGTLHSEIGKDFDNYIILNLLGATLTTGTAANGNRALGEVHDKTMLNRILPPSELLCEVINSQLIDPWCDMNLPPGSPRPYFYIDTEESTDAKEARETLETAVKVGLEVAASEARERLGYREPVADEPVIGGIYGFRPLARADSSIDPEKALQRRAESIASTQPEETAATSGEPVVSMAERSFGCVMLTAPEETATAVRDYRRQIDEEDLHPDLNDDSPPHVTVLYGLTNDDPTAVKRALLGVYPVWAAYGALKMFQNENADVLYIEVEDEFGEVGSMRNELLNGTEYDTEAAREGKYIPHLTVAYLKPGRGSKYTVSVDSDGQPTDWPVYTPLSGTIDIFDVATFSDRNEATHEYKLTGMYAEFAAISPESLQRVLKQLPVESPNRAVPSTRILQEVLRCARSEGTLDREAKVMGRVNDPRYADRSIYRSVESILRMAVASDKANATASTVLKHGVLSVELWRQNPELRAEEFARAEEEAAASEERQELMAEALSEEGRPAVVRTLENTARNIDKMWLDNDAPLSLLAYNAIDIDPIVEESDRAASIAVYGTFLMALGYTHNIAEAAQAARRGELPNFWDSAPVSTFVAGDFTFEGWSTAYGAAADWMMSRGVMTLTQVRYVAGLMAEQTGQDRDNIERELRQHYFALARTVDVNATRRVQAYIADAVGRGETVTQFLNRIDKELGIGEVPGGMDSYWENVWRTEVANAYSQQQQRQEADPDYDEVLWGHLGGNPDDRRSDPTHADFNKVLYRKRSAASVALGRPPFRYRCRCYMTPIVDPDPEFSEHKESSNAMEVALKMTRF